MKQRRGPSLEIVNNLLITERRGRGWTGVSMGRGREEGREVRNGLTIEIEEVTRAVQWLASQTGTEIAYAINHTDSMNLLQKFVCLLVV